MNETAVKLRDCALTLENDSGFHDEYKAGSVNAGTAREIIRGWLRKNGCAFSGQNYKEEREHLRRYFDDIYDMPVHDHNSLAHLPSFEFWRDDVCYPPAAPIPGQLFNVSFAKITGINDRSNWEMYGKTWVVADENKLTDLFWAGKDLKAMCEALKRPPNGIITRLVHLRCLSFDPIAYKYFVARRPKVKPTPPPEPTPVELKQEIDDHLSAAAECFSDLSNSLKEILMTKSTEIIKIETKTFVNGVDISTMEDAAIYQLIATQEAEIEELDKIKNKPKKLKEEIAKRQEGITALVSYLDSKAD